MADEQKMQQKYQEFQILQQQIEQINQNIELLIQQNAELDISINAVNEIQKTDVENEILAPIANGIFIKAKLINNQKMIVNVGSNTTVEKTIPEVVELLKEQQKVINTNLVKNDKVLDKLNSQAMQIYHEVEEMNQ